MPHRSTHPGGQPRRRALGGWFLVAVLVAWPTLLSAQEQRTVRGSVTSAETLGPLVGVQITAEGTNVGTVTDGEGNFSLAVPEGATTLVFTSIGYRTVEVPIEDQVEVTLEQQAIELEGLVVTALGIEREQRTVPFAAQSVSGDRLTETPKTNVVSALQGNVAGIHVTNSASPFGSARIVSRGAASLLGENQPLIVVDGIPVSNSSATVTGYGDGSMGGYDVGNAAADFDANNVESVTVLKGPNAAALYGSRAANGAIEISTKKGSGPAGATGFGLSMTIGSTFSTPLKLPAYQNQYGQGFQGAFQFVDGNGGGINDAADESWGPKLDGRLIDQFHGKQQPWVAHPDNVSDFWDTGMLSTLNVAVSRSAERSNMRLSVSRHDENGMYPNNRNIRTGVTLAGGAQISDRLSAEASIDYINDGRRGMPKQSYDDAAPMQNFIWFGRQVDTNLLNRTMVRDLSDPMTQDILAGTSMRADADIPYSWNYSYHDNPYWMASRKKTDFNRHRLFGHAALTYDFNDWLSLTGRVGRDWYDDALRANYPVNTVDGTYRLGSFYDRTETHSQTTGDFLFTAQRPLMSDLNVTLNAGGVISRNEQDFGTGEVTELVVPGVYTLENSAGQPNTKIEKFRKQVNSLYGSASFNYKDWFNVDVTGRNDWSSTLPENNNSYFYPSIGAALIFTDALGIQSDILTYGKLRASWTRVGNDTDPYQLAAVYRSGIDFGASGTPWAGQPTFTVDDELPNANLKPEQTTGVEVGTDLGLFNNRLILNATLYEKRTKDQILPVDISNATGFESAWVNSGEVRNRGVELVANITPVETENFRWNVVANWAKNDSKVLSLYSGVDRVVVGTFWNISVTADVGQPYGTLVGTKWARDEEGHILVDDNGLPIRDSEQVVVGNYNPDWVGGIGNTFTYKNLSLSVLFDGQFGGEVYSVTKWFGSYSGVLERTLLGRENDWDDKYVVPNAVYESTGEPNTTPVLAEEYWHNTFYSQEDGLVDATYVKLRDARLAYTLPDAFVSRLGFSSATLALVGHNLFLWDNQDIIDPETAFDTENRQGVENAQLPTARSIGFTLSVRP